MEMIELQRQPGDRGLHSSGRVRRRLTSKGPRSELDLASKSLLRDRPPARQDSFGQLGTDASLLDPSVSRLRTTFSKQANGPGRRKPGEAELETLLAPTREAPDKAEVD